MPKFVLLWTDAAIWLLFAALVVYGIAVGLGFATCAIFESELLYGQMIAQLPGLDRVQPRDCP